MTGAAPSSLPRRLLRRRLHADLSRVRRSRARATRASAPQHGIAVDPARFDDAVAASSFILDEVEEPVYDDGLFVHYTATIIEHMGGRGPDVVRRGARIYEQWAGNHHFEMYDDVAPVLRALRRARLDRRRDLQLDTAASTRSCEHFTLRRADHAHGLVGRARLHEAASQHLRRGAASRPGVAAASRSWSATA